jgi:hypothetical protein
MPPSLQFHLTHGSFEFSLLFFIPGRTETLMRASRKVLGEIWMAHVRRICDIWEPVAGLRFYPVGIIRISKSWLVSLVIGDYLAWFGEHLLG